MQDKREVLPEFSVRKNVTEAVTMSPEVILTRLDEMNLSDRFLFAETMECQEAYQATIEILLSREVDMLSQTETEKELRISPDLRQVRLDVVGMDIHGQIYHAEMQKKNTNNLIRRSRYYQSQLDASLLSPGSVQFNDLKDTTMILVAPFDLFGYGLYRYTFQGHCLEVPDLKIEDGATRVFINTNGTNQNDFSQEFLDFMGYINQTTDAVAEKTESERIRRIHQRVQQVRLSEKMGVKNMQLWEEKVMIHNDAVAWGLSQGLSQDLSQGKSITLITQICKKLRKGLGVEQIADALEIEGDFVREIRQAAETCGTFDEYEKIYNLWKGKNANPEMK